MQNLPVFVYGTLRVGHGNHRSFLGGVIDMTPATLEGASMTNVGFPYVWRTPTGNVTGELMTIDPERYDRIVASLDMLEGYGGPGGYNHYEREIVEVILEDGTRVQAYTYLVDEDTASRGRPVPGGDFNEVCPPMLPRRQFA